MADITNDQALKEAEELRLQFGSNSLMNTRRAIVARQMPAKLDALGLDPQLENIVPYETDAPNQEARQYATAVSLAKPEVQVFVESEKSEKVKAAEHLETFYGALVQQLASDDYDVCRDMAVVGLGVRRLDEKGRFFKDTPHRKDDEKAEDFNDRTDAFRKDFGLPLSFPRVNPATFYYVENQEHTKVIFGVEWMQARESDVKKEGSFTERGELLIVRTLKTIRHFWKPVDGDAEPVFSGENRFGHTGYILYRGPDTGDDDPQRRYDPLAMITISQAQVRNLFVTMRANLAVQTAAHWLETDQRRDQSRQGRAVNTERKLKSRGAQARTSRGGAAAEFEEGVHVRRFELSRDADNVLARMDLEEERYRFRDVLMGEAQADASGRLLIRQQEAAGRQLSPPFRSRKTATEELITVVRRTMFERPEYLGGKNNKQTIFIPHLVEGLGEGGDFNKAEIISLTQADNLPHSVKVAIDALTQAAQLALIEEGLKLEGVFSRDTIDEDFYKIRDIPRENRRRVKDLMRQRLIPVAIEDGTQQGLAALQKIPIQTDGLVAQPTGGPGQGGARPGESGLPDAVRSEDLAASLTTDAGVVP